MIFMDEIDAIGGKRFSEGTAADREVQRTLMELLSQLDGFESLGQVKIVMATNRPDILDPALLRPGRLDRKIEIPLPNDAGRGDILKIHAGPIAKQGEFGTCARGLCVAPARRAHACLHARTRMRARRYCPRADWDAIVKLTEGFNGADMRNVCTEAGMFAIRADRDYVVEEDFMKAARKIAETKKLETKLEYTKV